MQTVGAMRPAPRRIRLRPGSRALAATACALALALLACAPPAAAELCDGSLHAYNTKYEPVAVYHELSEGTFRGFCAKSTASLTYSWTPNPAESWS